MGAQGHNIRKQGIRLLLIFLALSVLAGVLCTSAHAEGREHIINFDSRITVNQDSSMQVVETITVESTGDQIKRGIYRDFPTKYKDRLGNSYTVGFEVESVLRNGKTDKYRVENISNGKRVYIGREDYILPPGIYTYIIAYRTDRQLGFFEGHDELYWNVTGNGWAFPVDKAAASVILPEGVPAESIETEGYTGPQGSKAQNYNSKVSSGTAEFITTKPLNSREGLTIVVAWPKGHVVEPSTMEKVSRMAKDNSGIVFGVAGLFILLLYYLITWWIVGRDPAREAIIPIYNPPYGLSPASMRYIREMGYDQKSFAATLINMAVKGYLWVNEVQGKYTLMKGAADELALDNDERAIADILALNRYGRLDINNRNHTVLGPAINALKDSLKASYGKRYFKNNSGYLCGGVAITLILILIMVLSDRSGDSFMLIWSTLWSIGVGSLLMSTITAWRIAAKSKDRGRQAHAVILTLIAVLFLLVLVVVSLLSGLSNLFMVLIIIAVVSVNIIFFKLLKAHTLEGRRITDKIEGFRMYLSVAEKDRMNLMNPPERTPELFEKYLPYALALGVEQQWGEQFASILSVVNRDGTYYYPSWYRGTMWNSYNVAAFTGFLGSSFSGVISSASTPPGSSSGMHGGGSSGGGGGGGGGGGW